MKKQPEAPNGRGVHITLDTRVDKAPRSLYLETKKFLIAPEGAIFYDLVTEGWSYTGYDMDDHIRQYIGLMLEGYIKKTDIFSILLAYSYLQSSLEEDKINSYGLKEIADIALLSLTIFSGRFLYRHFSLTQNDCVGIGVSLYKMLAEREKKESWWNEAYYHMSSGFMTAVAVLKSLDRRGVSGPPMSILACPDFRESRIAGISTPQAVDLFKRIYLDPDENQTRTM